MSIPEGSILSWEIDGVAFTDYGVHVAKSAGVLDMPRIVDESIDWPDLDGKDYWQDAANVKYQDREITLSCWIRAASYSDFQTKVAAFYAALVAPGERTLLTPWGNSIEHITVQQAVQMVRKTQYVSAYQVGMFTLRLTVAGDSKTRLMPVYRGSDVLQVLKYGPDAKFTRSLQGTCEITMSCEFSSMQTLGRGDMILWDDEPYFALEYPQIDKLGTNKFVYRLTYVHQFFLLKDIQYRVIDRSNTYWWATMDDIVGMIVTNANRAYSGLFVKGTIDTTEHRNHQLQDENCHDVLNRIASEYELEWGFSYNTSNNKIYLNVKKQLGDMTGLYLSYGPGNQLVNLKRVSSGRDQMVTRLYAYGSDKNIPASYGYPRLKLATEPLTRDFYGMHIERTKIFEDIFPERTGHVSGYTYTASPDTTKPELAIYQMVDSSMPFDLNAADSFGTKYLIVGTNAKIHFNSGDLAGFEFEILSYKHASKTFSLIPYKDEQGTIYPTADLYPKPTDEYKIIGINIPAEYITDAETRLQAAADAWIDEHYQPKATYTVETLAGVNPSGSWVGKKVNIVDTDFGIADYYRITDITTNMYNGSGSLTLSEYVDKSVRQNLQLKVATIERSLKNAKLDTVETIRANEVTSGALKNAILNPLDEKINNEKYRLSIVTVTASDTPVVTNYNTLYAIGYGQHPTVELFQIDSSGNRIKRTEQPYFIMADGLIQSITFGTLPEPISGFIKIQ